MLKIKQYVKAESLEQAYELNQKKTNRIVGGMLWLKMSTAHVWYPFGIWIYTKD